MNLATAIILFILTLAIWYAIRTLRQNNGNPCSSCRGGDECIYCKKQNSNIEALKH